MSILFFNSGLKILLLTNSKRMKEFCLDNKRYDMTQMTMDDFAYDGHASPQLLAWKDQFNEQVLKNIKLIDYYQADDNLYFRLIKKLKWDNFFLNKFFVALTLFNQIQPRTLHSLWRRIKLSWMAVNHAQVKLIAKKLCDSQVGLIISSSLSISEQFLMLASARYAKIPIGFYDEAILSRENMLNSIQQIEPIAQQMRQKRCHADIKHISDIYGAKTIVANYCDLAKENISVPGFWMHGWIPAYHNVHPAFIALHKTERKGVHFPWSRDRFDKTDLQLVTREDQAIFLRQHGYMNVKAIGHPLVYLDKNSNNKRIKNSLLVAPPHGTGKRDENDPQVKAYVDYIDSIKSKFDVIALCVTVDDYIKGNWWPAFQKINIENVISVDRSDLTSFYRLFHILSRFEYVTTNSFGSIVAYAAFLGCKISVSGPYVEIPATLLKKAHAILHFPMLLEKQIALCAQDQFRAHYPDIFTSPDCAKEHTTWGSFELGECHRLSREEMRTLFTLKSHSL